MIKEAESHLRDEKIDQKRFIISQKVRVKIFKLNFYKIKFILLNKYSSTHS